MTKPTKYKYIFHLPDGTKRETEPVVGLVKLLRVAYQVVEANPDAFDEKQAKTEIKEVIGELREAVAFIEKTNKGTAKEKADRLKSIELHEKLAKKKQAGIQDEDIWDGQSPDLEAVLAVPPAKGIPRSKDYAYVKAWREKKKAQQLAAGIEPKKRGRPRNA